MRLTVFWLALLLLAGCSSFNGSSRHSSKAEKPKVDPPETVIVTYHVKPGSEPDLKNILNRAWKIYQKEGMVNSTPHLIFRDKDSWGTARYVEIFTWINHAKPEHAPADVKKIWDEMQGFCEARDGHPGIDGGEIMLVTGN